MLTPPSIVVTRDKDQNPLYSLHFATEQEAQAYLNQIECKAFPSSVIHTPGLAKPYHTDITFKAIRLCRQFFRPSSQIKKPKGKFVLKSLRADEKGFFKDFIKTITIGEKKPLRVGPKRIYTVTGKGIFKRKPPSPDDEESLSAKSIPLKKPQYTKAEKKGFSKAQAASLGDADHHPNVFGFNVTQRNNVLSGIILDCKNVLFTDRNYLSDSGTVKRNYDFDELDDAEHFYKRYATTHYDDKQIYASNEIDIFLAELKKRETEEKETNKFNIEKKKSYNEILARMRYDSLDSIQFFIAADTLVCRLQTREYARQFHRFIQEQKLDTSTASPTCVYYLPEEDSAYLHFSVYSKEEQILDELEARLIRATYQKPLATDVIQLFAQISNDNSREEYYKNKSYQFLLALTPDEIKTELQSRFEGYPVFWHVLNSGVQLMESLAELGGFDLTNAINDPIYATSIFHNAALFHLTRAGYGDAVANYINAYTGKVNLERVMPLSPLEPFDVNLACLAVTLNQINVVKALIPKEIYLYDGTAFDYIAAQNGFLEMFKLVCQDRSAHIITTLSPLRLASQNNHFDIVNHLIKNKIDEHYLDFALYSASEAGHRKIVKHLIEHGANVNSEGIDYHVAETPLYAAAESGHYQVVKDLLEAGANANASTKNSWAPIIRAAIHGYFKIVKLLVEYGANINARDHNGYSALHWATSYKDMETFIYLVDQGAEVIASDLRNVISYKLTQIEKMVEKIFVNDNRLNRIRSKLLKTSSIEQPEIDTEPNAKEPLETKEPETQLEASEVSLSRRAALLTLRATVKDTRRYDNDMVEKLEKRVDDFIHLDETCGSLLASAKLYRTTNPLTAQDLINDIVNTYNLCTDNLPDTKRILATLVQKAESFNNNIKAELKTKKPNEKIITYLSFVSLWKREEVLTKEIQANVSKFAPISNSA